MYTHLPVWTPYAPARRRGEPAASIADRDRSGADRRAGFVERPVDDADFDCSNLVTNHSRGEWGCSGTATQNHQKRQGYPLGKNAKMVSILLILRVYTIICGS
eukprot:SAG22_NODE_10548_length_528_cov_1.307692_1_plen_102_part_10